MQTNHRKCNVAKYGHLKIFKLIFNSVLDMNPKNFNGETPLSLAARIGNFDILKIQLESKKCGLKRKADDITSIQCKKSKNVG